MLVSIFRSKYLGWLLSLSGAAQDFTAPLLRPGHFVWVALHCTRLQVSAPLPSPLFGKYTINMVSMVSFPLISSVTVPGWMPLTGLSWLPAALGCSSWLHQPLRHLPHAHLLLMSLICFWLLLDAFLNVTFSWLSFQSCPKKFQNN